MKMPSGSKVTGNCANGSIVHHILLNPQTQSAKARAAIGAANTTLEPIFMAPAIAAGGGLAVGAFISLYLGVATATAVVVLTAYVSVTPWPLPKQLSTSGAHEMIVEYLVE
jgi:hypothetical protein